MPNFLKALAEFKTSGNDEARSFTAKITTNALDRDGEVMLPRGADLKDYRKNPVVMWNHDYGQPPIGKAIDIKSDGDFIIAKAEMASTPFAQEIHMLMREGMIRGVSIGFEPVESRQPSKKDIEQFGEKVRRIYHKWKLLEFSVTPLPANQEALVFAVSKGILTRDRAKSLFGVELTDAVKPKRVVYFYAVEPKPVMDRDALIASAVSVAMAKKFGRATI